MKFFKRNGKHYATQYNPLIGEHQVLGVADTYEQLQSQVGFCPDEPESEPATDEGSEEDLASLFEEI